MVNVIVGEGLSSKNKTFSPAIIQPCINCCSKLISSRRIFFRRTHADGKSVTLSHAQLICACKSQQRNILLHIIYCYKKNSYPINTSYTIYNNFSNIFITSTHVRNNISCLILKYTSITYAWAGLGLTDQQILSQNSSRTVLNVNNILKFVTGIGKVVIIQEIKGQHKIQNSLII